MRPDITVDMVVELLTALALWCALFALVAGALAAELHMWRRALRREGVRKQRAARRRHG